MKSKDGSPSSRALGVRAKSSDRRASGTAEPIAIVGMACRFPGAPDISSFWRLLEAGGNSITESTPAFGVGRVGQIFPDGTVPSEACRFGAFVDDIELFDAGFFRISPVEAQLLDPQQRMMLETSWQALEDAGIDPDRLKESLTGVYTGISNDEYRMLVLDSTKPSGAAECLYALSGTNLNGTSGRVSFVLGLMGPAKAVDAACASSLVSVHDAVADLQQGKADLAIAGGVQAMLNSRIYELRADAMMLSPDGQSKAFDASANGYVRGEGCGVVVLKRLSDAEADGDRIWAVIRGVAVNHGGASSGLTVPHTPALVQVIETALSQAGIPPAEVDYLEAHGTGTAVGDPIEINAVADVYGRGRDPDHPLLVASVKTNIGHLESAAGIAGLIKTALVVNRGVLPKHLHFRDPNPRLDWNRLPLRITTALMDWPNRPGRPRRAGVNSFGISGTNAHIVVEEYLAPEETSGEEHRAVGPARVVAVSLPETAADLPLPEQGLGPRSARFLPLSGKSPAALRELAARYLSWLDEPPENLSAEGAASEPALSDMAWTAGVGRSHFDQRAGVVFHDAGSLREGLKALIQSGEDAGPAANTVAFAYTGQGSQWVGMGRTLYESEPVARAVLDRCESVFREQRGTSLLDVMFGRTGGEGDLGDTAWEQPALYALECALTALWASVGVRPAAVLGHSVGEIAAAQAAGVFSLEDGMRLAATRGTLLSGIDPGAMAAVFAPAARVAAVVEAANDASAGVGVNISADNGTHQVVSGPVAGIENLSKRFDSEGIRVRRLNTTKAFHSALVEPALDALEAFLGGVTVESPSLAAVVSNLTGRVVEAGERLDGVYWRRHAREPVAFASGVRTLAEFGVDLVVEIGPHSVLAPMAVSAWPESPGRPAPRVLPSLSRPSGDDPADPDDGFVEAVAGAYRAGLPVRFEGLFAGEARRRIPLPGYPFQRERHWLEAPKQRRGSDGHPLLGVRHESARGEISFETEVFPSDPAWLSDHRLFGRVVAPGALYGAMAATAALAEGGGAVVEDMQLHNPLVFPEQESGDGAGEDGRRVQVVLDAPGQAASRGVQLFSKGSEGEWTVHMEGRVPSGAPAPQPVTRVDLDGLKAGMAPVEVADYYRARAETGIDLGPSFRSLGRIWARPGEALGEVSFPEALGRNGLDVHPLVLDGCFQVVGAARGLTGTQGATTYLPFGWERLWLAGRLPERVVCHVRMNMASPEPEEVTGEAPEVLSGDLNIYDPDGVLLGVLSGYTVKRATREALLSAVEGVKDLLYEVVWRDSALAPGLLPADFFPSPATVAAASQSFSGYLTGADVDPEDRCALLEDLERWSWSHALATLDKLRWRRRAGEVVDPEDLRQRLGVKEEHQRLFRRMLEMLARSGVLEEAGDGFTVVVGSRDRWPDEMPPYPDLFGEQMADLYPDGSIEVGLFRRSGAALADVLRGRADPLTLLFSSGEPTAADLYLKAPVARAANRMLADAVQVLVARIPEGRRLRVLEIGAGTGSATASVLPELADGRFDYTYTDISAGFFAEAEARFGNEGIEYRPLDIEKDPIPQGFESHGYDLLIASNVLHATRYLPATLGHCLDLLAPSGHLIALENLSDLGWMDLTFGQLDGWWRFADDYRPHHALANPAVWRRALGDAGFTGAEVLGPDESETDRMPDKGVIVAQGPAQVTEPPGVWVLAADHSGVAAELATELAARNQTVVLADGEASGSLENHGAGVLRTAVDAEDREAWRSLLEGLPQDIPFNGVAHLAGLDGHGAEAEAAEIAEDVSRAGASALALTQAVADVDVTPAKGVWFVTRGAQVLERERGGELAGAILWGFGKAVAREAAHLQPRMIDLDPGDTAPVPDLLSELLYPDPENHIAYRSGRRRVARLVRAGAGVERLSLPEQPEWTLAPDPAGVFEKPYVMPLPARPLEPREVRVAVDAAGLNFWDVFRSLGFIEEGNLGREMCGRIVDVGSDVSAVSAGDPVVGLGFGAFAAEMITHEELVAPAPPGIPVTGLATVPIAFVSAALSYEFTGLEAGDRVLIHAGGVGLAAIQLAQAAGAEVFATASAPEQAYLWSLGVDHIYDSRQTAFGKEILDDTDGAGVDVVLNSLTEEGFIDASLSCLKHGGRFMELARRDILSADEMAAARPDVAYLILDLDVLKKTDPAWVGRVLRGVMERIVARELEPIIHSRWPLSEAGAALSFMRSARHLGKIVVTASPLATGRLRQDRSYLVTGGLGGIGCAVAGWLADHGAGTIVLNGRRAPDDAAEEAIDALRERGVTVQVELADVSDAAAVDAMLERIDGELPPLGGVIHSVGVLSDGALTNQSWERFETVLWPKVLGGWHLHRATADRDLEFFILFSSRVGVMGNPGQANHASANAFLDQLAGHRRALGLPGQSIAWGAWSEIGEAAEQRERIDLQRTALGGRWFTPQQGLRALDQLVRQDATHSVVMAMDWSMFEEAVEDRPLFLEDLLTAPADDDAGTGASSDDLLSRLRGTSVGSPEELLVSFLQQEVRAVLRLPATPAPTVGFFDLGMDSLMAVELRNRLNQALADVYTVPNTAVFDYPDIAALARHLVGELGEVGSALVPQAQPETRAEAQPAAQATPAVRHGDDGIAIVGMACRFPGAPDLSAFWRQLEAGENAVTDRRRDAVSSDDLAAGLPAEYAAYARGGFVDGIEGFDAEFFRITPIEARMMDPRQRMMLETTWQALEDAGMDPGGLRGSQTGIYAGIGTSEYRDLMTAGAYGVSYLGTAASMAVGRVAFHLGVEGPTMPVDLDCASSLVAVHHALAGLRGGEVDMALVGGVAAVLSPGITREMADLGMLSRGGQCRAFDAAADGFVRGEGCGMVVLKRLGDAVADGDCIWGVIRSSAVNQNGASAGPTVPNGRAQARVIEEALSRAGVAPSEVDYLETHGAGSQLGDTIEVQAAAAVYGKGRKPEQPLLIGSVKTNIGHLEPAAGVAGLIKTVLAMKRGVIPKQLHFDDPNPNVNWERLPVRVTSEAVAWPAGSDRPPLAAVSAFGISGTNAHVVVGGYAPPGGGSGGSDEGNWPQGSAVSVPVLLPDAAAPPAGGEVVVRTARLLPLSGKTDGVLRELARRYLSWLDERGNEPSLEDAAPERRLSDMAWTAGVGRSHFDCRKALVFRDAASLREGLKSLAEGSGEGEPVTATKVAFVYSGQGRQWAGMGRALYEDEPLARAVLDRCEAVVRQERDASLLDVMFGGTGGEGGPDEPGWMRPAVYALECTLTALWSSVGIRPGVAMGRGPGELAAAQAAGVFGLEEGLRLAMASAREGREPGPGGLEAVLAGVALAPPSLVLVSGETGCVVESGDVLDKAYWTRQGREPASFTECVQALASMDVDVVVEIGVPDPGERADTGADRGTPVVLTSLRRDAPPDNGFVEAVAGAYEAGLEVSFAGLFAGESRRRISLPGYPFERRRYWIEARKRPPA